MQSIPGNKYWQGTVEFGTLVNFYMGPRSHILGQICLFGALQSLAVAAVIQSSQTLDHLLVDVWGRSCGVGIVGMNPDTGNYNGATTNVTFSSDLKVTYGNLNVPKLLADQGAPSIASSYARKEHILNGLSAQTQKGIHIHYGVVDGSMIGSSSSTTSTSSSAKSKMPNSFIDNTNTNNTKTSNQTSIGSIPVVDIDNTNIDNNISGISPTTDNTIDPDPLASATTLPVSDPPLPSPTIYSGPNVLGLQWICVTEHGSNISVFGYTYMLFTLGYVLLLVVVVPLCLFPLGDFVWVQLVSFTITVIIFSQWIIQSGITGLDPARVPTVGDKSGFGALMGVVMLNFAFVQTIPAWVNVKRPDVDVQKSIWGTTSLSLVFYLAVGMFRKF
jgi:hypothetical protein